MDEWIQMADNEKIQDAYVVKMDTGKIAIYANRIRSVRSAWEIFGNPEKTSKMHSFQYGDEADWEGYTEVTAMQASESGAVICLKQEAISSGE